MKLEHIGIAVRSIEEARKTWEKLGLKLETLAQVEHQKVRVAVYNVKSSVPPAVGGINSGSHYKAQGVKIELVEPMSEDSPIANFLEKRGEGLHHLCFEVENIDKLVTELKGKGIKLIDEKPRPGAFVKKVVFLHPKSTGGVLIELCEGISK